MASRPARESSSSLLILGNLTPQQAKKLRNCLADILGDDHIQHVHFPSQQHHDGQAGDRNCQSFLPEIDPSMPAVLEVNSSMDSFCKNLYYRGKLEFKLTKAIGAIGQYQKQHQELMDNFVCLSNKYQQLKSNFNAVRNRRENIFILINQRRHDHFYIHTGDVGVSSATQRILSRTSTRQRTGGRRNSSRQLFLGQAHWHGTLCDCL